MSALKLLPALFFLAAAARAEVFTVRHGDKRAVARALARAQDGDELVLESETGFTGILARGVRGRSLVMGVEPFSPAARAGLAMGDIVEALASQKHAYGPRGETVTVAVLRGDALDPEPSTLVYENRRIELHGDYDRGQVAYGVGDHSLARKYWLRVQDDPRAQLELAEQHRYGTAVRKDLREAERWYLKAAEQGERVAIRVLLSLYQWDKQLQDPAKLASWRQRAAALGDPDALHALGWDEPDPAKKLDYYRRAAALRHSGAMRDLADMLEHGKGVPADPREALHWARERARLWGEFDPFARLFQTLPPDPEDAAGRALFERYALEKGRLRERALLSWRFLSGEGAPRDGEKALELLRLSADENYPPAINALGWLALNGVGMPRDAAAAREWFEKAAKLGDGAAANNLGWLYLSAAGVDKDEKKGAELILKSRGLGVPAAAYNEGLLREHGVWLSKDPWGACNAYEDGAKRGDSGSQVMAAGMLERGDGCAQDLRAAADWYRKAADAGDPVAQRHMGRLYENGIGVTKDLGQAALWYGRAAAERAEPPRANRLNPEFAMRLELERLLPDAAPSDALAARREAAESAARLGSAPARALPPSTLASPGYLRPERPHDLALVVGIEDYALVPKAEFAERDAEAARAHLLALGVPRRNLVHLAGREATRASLVKNLESWLPMNAKPDSRVFVYFSGHGAPDPVAGEAYLLPADGDARFLKDTAYPVRELYRRLAELPAERVLVLLDACFSGAGGRSALPPGARPLVTRIETGEPPAGKLVVLAASGLEEIAGSDAERGHGLFTYHLLKGLDGAAAPGGGLSVRALYEYLLPRVQDEARRQNRQQTPQLLPRAPDAGAELLLR